MSPVTEKVTNIIAAGALVSPAWLPTLGDVSQAFSSLLPILGGVWLIVQIVHRFWTWRKPPR